ncbi:MAG: winged helix-turn-helix transcriptional regulator [Burkholderiales bacterium]|nr:winged helix-turn-helix transcriptional regulator [Anaerolineae bacterium]
MIKQQPESLDTIFSALSDPTRRAILERLANGNASVTEVAAPFAMSLPAISKHLRILESAGLIAREKEGRVHHLRLAASPMKDAAEWLANYRQLWEEQFDSLARYLETTADDDPTEE